MDWTDLLGNSFARGLLIRYAPELLKGAMAQYLGQVKFQDMVDWINQGKNLWHELPEQHQRVFEEYGPRLGTMEWFNFEWVIDAGKDTAPALASLFLNWDEGKVWLEYQIEDIKFHIGVQNANRA